MPAPSLSREEVAQILLAEFRRSGYEGASLSTLSAATGLGKSSLYHYFPNGKVDMGRAAMEVVGHWMREKIIPLLTSDAEPEKRLKRYFAAMSDFYAKGTLPCLTDLFTIGEAAGYFQQQFKQNIGNTIKLIAAVLEDAGFSAAEAARRAEDGLVMMHGALVVSRAQGSTAVFARVVRGIPDMLLAP
ncbi:TetR/AcrR family transcriptional regulator [Herbaspirillum sp. LeCh32-8]|uniref:TetR/AcrR family transcriptional regulator n=1 Tax=Herbaspirillum sp. LeCh32-8 TaxID=2821356 RepID=UPI001AE33A39|nr:TetR/AcrR family transcriptional regulator [Herbaspirillum sp. LeCh32-8]MBP0598180.1 TetR/AcrR family transcriptional regulator [Herbaspirillum sp. LeCh32-8]